MESSQKMLNSLKGFSNFSVGAGHSTKIKTKKRIQRLMHKINKVPAHKQHALSPNTQRLHTAKSHAARESRERRAKTQASVFDDISQSLQKLRVDARKAIVSVPEKTSENIEDAINRLSNRFQNVVGLKKQYKKNSAQIKQNSTKPKSSKKPIRKTVRMEVEPTKRNPPRNRKNPDRLTSSVLRAPRTTRASKAAKKRSASPQRRNSV